MMVAPDPFELLQRHVRALVPTAPRPDDDELIEQIIAGTRMSSVGDAPGPRRWRSRRIIVGAVIGLAASGGLAVAAWNRAEEPTAPELGVACMSSAPPTAAIVALGPGADPIGRCAQAWRDDPPDGPLRSAIGGSDVVPDLVACIGRAGTLEVYPGAASTCAALGLADAAPDVLGPDATLDPRAELSQRLADQINSGCLTSVRGGEVAAQILADMDLTDWRVQQIDGEGPCSVAAVVFDAQIVNIRPSTP